MTDVSTKRWALALTSLAAFIVVTDSQIMTVALATLRDSLHASIESLQWTVNAYTLTFAVLLLFGAALGDRFGRRRIFVAGIAIFVSASAACALAPDATALIAARAIQGAGSALIMPLAITLLSLAYPPQERGKAIGIFTACVGLSLICGPLLGGALTQAFSWHAIFWVNVPLGLIAIPLVLRHIGESKAETSSFDTGGVALMTVSAFGLVFGLIRAAAQGWTDGIVVASLGIGAILLAGFIAWEALVSEPMLPLRLFRSRAFSAGNATNFAFNASMYGTLFFLPQFLQTSLHFDPLGAGLRILPWTATLFVVGPFAGMLIDRFGERGIIAGGLLAQAAGNLWLAVAVTQHVSYAQLIAPMIVMGAGVSFAIPATQRVILNAVDRADAGKASGTFTMSRYLGGIFGVAILATLFSRFGSFGSAGAFAAGFAPVMWGAAVCSLIAAIAGALLPAPAARLQAPAATMASGSKLRTGEPAAG